MKLASAAQMKELDRQAIEERGIQIGRASCRERV